MRAPSPVSLSLYVLMLASALAQQPRPSTLKTEDIFPTQAEWNFVRTEYTDLPQFHRRFGWSSRGGTGTGWWMMDWPDAERHFTSGVGRLTRLTVGEPTHFRLTDPKLFNHPWIYATQVGWWDLSEAEAKGLGDYLRRGGFLLVDDFFGEEQWRVFRETMERILPGAFIDDLTETETMMNVLYSIPGKDRTFIPGSRHLRRHGSGELTIEQPPGTIPAWRAVRDERNRVVVSVSYNMDVADAWEFADWAEYPEQKTSLAYRYGINTIIYAMTH